ncbi:hypothetical protein COO91_05560 [Nostoc flagelliforme CCNUN1]|uniref:Uncharacterized protein n=1 Tax=Nostoc flagelliforme CCNUN1 TaxID=2038116 RepID=A0A2K8SVU6_9NOSO|nr:hypothetical protein COO91_05560 [Nostoc flagelliforme CCNUN1]
MNNNLSISERGINRSSNLYCLDKLFYESNLLSLMISLQNQIR